jgi:hypothetical protein
LWRSGLQTAGVLGLNLRNLAHKTSKIRRRDEGVRPSGFAYFVWEMDRIFPNGSEEKPLAVGDATAVGARA